MSVHWTIRCDTHEVWGPDIRRSAESAPRLARYYPRRHGTQTPDHIPAARAWALFLSEHEWCDLRLVHE